MAGYITFQIDFLLSIPLLERNFGMKTEFILVGLCIIKSAPFAIIFFGNFTD